MRRKLVPRRRARCVGRSDCARHERTNERTLASTAYRLPSMRHKWRLSLRPRRRRSATRIGWGYVFWRVGHTKGTLLPFYVDPAQRALLPFYCEFQGQLLPFYCNGQFLLRRAARAVHTDTASLHSGRMSRDQATHPTSPVPSRRLRLSRTVGNTTGAHHSGYKLR